MSTARKIGVGLLVKLPVYLATWIILQLSRRSRNASNYFHRLLPKIDFVIKDPMTGECKHRVGVPWKDSVIVMLLSWRSKRSPHYILRHAIGMIKVACEASIYGHYLVVKKPTLDGYKICKVLDTPRAEVVASYPRLD